MPLSLPLGISLAGRSQRVASFSLAGREGLETISEFVTFSSSGPKSFVGELTAVQLGAVVLHTMRSTPLVGVRTPERIAARPVAMMEFDFVAMGSARWTQQGRSVEVRAAAPIFIDSQIPYKLETFEPSVLVGVAIPVSLLGDRYAQVSSLTATQLPESSLLSATTNFLLRFVEGLPVPGSAVAAYAERAISEMVVAVAAELTDGQVRLGESGLRMEVRDFIEQNLLDPNLTPVSVARAAGISREKLYRLFRNESTTIAAFIRQARVEEAARRLRNRDRSSVAALARQTGFGGPDHLTRVFRATFGMSPSAYRSAVEQGIEPRPEGAAETPEAEQA